MRLRLRFLFLESGASFDRPPHSDTSSPYSDSPSDDEQSLSDHWLSGRAGGRETGLASGDENDDDTGLAGGDENDDDREIGLDGGGREIGLDGGDTDGISMDDRETSILSSEARGVKGERGREVGARIGEPRGESIPASSSSRAALIDDRKECRVTIFSRGANMENSRPVRV